MAAYRYSARYRTWYRPSHGTVPRPVAIGAAVLVASGLASGAGQITHHHHHQAHASVASAPAGSTTPGKNEQLGDSIASAPPWNWPSGQVSCLNWLWTRESGWSQYADTRVTHSGGDGPGSAVFAYGIAQARPATKMPRAAWPADLGGQSSRAAQIRWGLGYIADTPYHTHTPCQAWAHEESAGWY